MKHLNKQLTAIASILIFSIGVMLSCNSFADGGKKATQAALDAEIDDRIAGDALLQSKIPEGVEIGDMQYWNGTEWSLIPAPVEASALIFSNDKPHWGYQIGDKGPAGGYVFHVTPNGMHGLEAAPVDQNDGAGTEWGCFGTAISGADGTAVGTGAQNTADILLGCPTDDIAADLADDYALNGYTNWFLPSKDELGLMHNELHLMGKGGFASDDYWSSSESSSPAWYQGFVDGLQGVSMEGSTFRVRAVRAF